MARDDESVVSDVLADITADALALPGLGSLTGRLMAKVKAEWRRDASKALAAAENASGLTREDFAEWIADEPRAVPLYMKVLWTAGMNGYDKTLTGMGAVLGAAARASQRDDAEGFADAEVALRAMENLTARHFVVLGVLAANEVTGSGEGKNYRQVTPDHVAGQTDLPLERVHQCMLNLAAAGLVYQLPVMGHTAYPVTELGRAVLQAADRVSDL